MKVLGIDEAGRGPVIGPMIMCGFMVSDDIKLNVKDSKELSQKRREELEAMLKKTDSEYFLLKAEASEIDENSKKSNLNKLEISMMIKIINKLKPEKVIIDSPESNTSAFAEKIRSKVDAEVIAENYADKNHPEVSAASILAKCEREREIGKLKEKYGDFGSGYTSDERTIKFLKNYIRINKEIPDFARKSWATSKNLLKEISQARIDDYGR